MRRTRTIIAACVVALVFPGSTALVSGTQPELADQKQQDEGVSIQRLAATPPLPLWSDVPISVSLQRITYETGTDYHAQFAGPVLLYVEAGSLSIVYTGEPLTLMSGPEVTATQAVGSNLARGDEIRLAHGESVLFPDGDTGMTRNNGQDQLVVLAMLIVPEVGSSQVEATAVDASDAP